MERQNRPVGHCGIRALLAPCVQADSRIPLQRIPHRVRLRNKAEWLVQTDRISKEGHCP